MIDLQQLRLEDARALLGHDNSDSLPSPDASASAYLQAVIDGLCQLSTKDPLTGLSNRRHFNAVLERELDAVARSGNSTLLLLLDIDHFKKINDTHGHPAGDLVLQTVARCMASCVRPQDTVARYGGEEFAVVLPDCQPAYGETVAERIRQSVADLLISVPAVAPIRITISIGGAFAPVWVRSTAGIWTERADTQLYLAKTGGRNRVCIEESQFISVSAEEKTLLFGPLTMGEPAWIEGAPDDPDGDTTQKVN